MYFSIRTNIIAWHNQILQAEIQRGDHVDEFLDQQGAFWDPEPIGSLPPLTFAINRKAPLLDDYQTGLITPLYSKRFIELLAEAGVHFESFPVNIIDQKTRTPLPVEYHLFHLLAFQSGLRMDIKGENAPCVGGIQMFRLVEAANIVLICEELQAAISKAKITGCKITPAKEVGLGTLAYLRKKLSRQESSIRLEDGGEFNRN